MFQQYSKQIIIKCFEYHTINLSFAVDINCLLTINTISDNIKLECCS